MKSLTPDFSGDTHFLDIVLEAKPDVFGHNVETVRPLYDAIRPEADLDRSLAVLHAASRHGGILVKTGFMVGLGESDKEIEDLILSIKEAGVDILTIGQYMRPSRKQTPVCKYWEPEAFTAWARLAKGLGIRYVIAGPLRKKLLQGRQHTRRSKGTQPEVRKWLVGVFVRIDRLPPYVFC